jgi:hypothetical protein
MPNNWQPSKVQTKTKVLVMTNIVRASFGLNPNKPYMTIETEGG